MEATLMLCVQLKGLKMFKSVLNEKSKRRVDRWPKVGCEAKRWEDIQISGDYCSMCRKQDVLCILCFMFRGVENDRRKSFTKRVIFSLQLTYHDLHKGVEMC